MLTRALIVLIVSFGFLGCLGTRSPKKMFHIALYPNSQGLEMIRDEILNHISNPSSPRYGQFLSPQTINRVVQPPESDILKVTKWLNRYNISYRVLGDTIHCIGSIYDIDQMLGTNLYNPGINRNIIGSTKDYKIPSHLNSVIQFIDGLVFRPHHHHKISRVRRNYKPQDQVSDGFVTREVLERVYNMVGSGLVHSSKTSVGVMEYQGNSGFSQSDMVMAQVASDVPSHNVSKEHIVGYDGSPDGESQLDMAVIWWGNGNATLWYEDYNGWMYGWASSFLNRKHYPEVVSLSWGWNEKDQCSIAKCVNETNKEYVHRTNNEFMKLAAKGVTIVVASGDAGSPGRTNEECTANQKSPINPVFPGSSEWVTSVGATYLVASDVKRKWKTPLCGKYVDCSNGTKEEITTFDKTGWTSGSGWAWWTKTPEWQKSEVGHYLNSGVYLPKKYQNNTLRWNPQGRGYPDVSAFGHGCTLYDGSNGWGTADGTSCSAPIFAGIIAHLNDHQRSKGKSPLGFANPLLYQMYRDDLSTFHDITVGNSACTEYTCCGKDYGFVPSKGWDVVSGLGTPNIGQMITWLDKHT